MRVWWASAGRSFRSAYGVTPPPAITYGTYGVAPLGGEGVGEERCGGSGRQYENCRGHRSQNTLANHMHLYHTDSARDHDGREVRR